jgi:predicted nuclease of restriction endonuclease-like RecB superfamily
VLLGNELVPRYLGERDYPWLRELIEQYRRCLGRPRRELLGELRRPLALRSPKNKQRIAAYTLDALARDESVAGVDPLLARRTLFSAAAERKKPRALLLGEVAALFGIEGAALERGLFADLPGERLLAEPALALSPISLAQEANFAIASGLVARAARLRIEARGDTRGLLRHAHLAGLISSVSEPTPGELRLEVSGPFALFRHTKVYGRALASLLPRLTWCESFELFAECPLRGSTTIVVFNLKSGDPIGVARELDLHDGAVEQRFVRDFMRLAPDWDAIPEPPPLHAQGRLLTFDFAIVHRQQPERRFLLEIVGFWTPDYVKRKLAELECGGLPPLILCLDENKACSPGELLGGAGAPASNSRVARLLRFRRRLDARAVLALIERDLV